MEMQQPNIVAFFKPSRHKTHEPPRLSDQINASEFSNPNPDPRSGDDIDDEIQLESREIIERSMKPPLKSDPVGKIPNKKRKYAQYHLELGQSDFLLHSCAVCGLMYARGEEGDEKVHKAFHKSYYQGIEFKGWSNERVVSNPGSSGDRILLVLDGDPRGQKHKLGQIINMMEKDLGYSDDQLLHKLCKVYLFISSHRIVGCLVAEPIRAARKVISRTTSVENSVCNCIRSAPDKMESVDRDSKRPNPSIKFGGFNFQREVVRRNSMDRPKVDHWDSGAILCEEEAVPALCGIRAIWVVPSNRRKRIASQLMDAVRNSFCGDGVLEPSQFAFSPPTSAGKAFASNYIGSNTFLVYKVDDV